MGRSLYLRKKSKRSTAAVTTKKTLKICHPLLMIRKCVETTPFRPIERGTSHSLRYLESGTFKLWVIELYLNSIT
jgi:hypothetical protein